MYWLSHEKGVIMLFLCYKGKLGGGLDIVTKGILFKTVPKKEVKTILIGGRWISLSRWIGGPMPGKR